MSLPVLTLFNLGIMVGYRRSMDSWRTPFEPSRSADSNGRRFVRIRPLTVKLFYILKMSLLVLTLFNIGITVGYRCPMDSWRAPFEPSRSADSNGRRFVRITVLTVKLSCIVKMSLPVLTLFNLGVTVGYSHPMDSWRAPFEPSRSADSNGRRSVRIASLTAKLFSILKLLLAVLTLFNFAVTVGYRHPMDSWRAPFEPARSADSNSRQFVQITV